MIELSNSKLFFSFDASSSCRPPQEGFHSMVNSDYHHHCPCIVKTMCQVQNCAQLINNLCGRISYSTIASIVHPANLNLALLDECMDVAIG
jgi:hypothetical protein